jgi:hypothetical protein
MPILNQGLKVKGFDSSAYAVLAGYQRPIEIKIGIVPIINI